MTKKDRTEKKEMRPAEASRERSEVREAVAATAWDGAPAFAFDPIRVKAEHVVHRLGGPTATARIVGVAKSQPSRWVKGQEAPSARSTRHLLDLDYVLSRLEQLYEGEVATAWLRSPNAFLGGAAPLDVLLREGPAGVIEAIDATIAGSYA